MVSRHRRPAPASTGHSPRRNRIAALTAALASANVRAHAHARAAVIARAEHHRLAAQFDTLIEVVPLGIVLFDADLRFIRINPALATVDGNPTPLYHGRTPSELQPQFAHLLEPLLRQVLTTGEPIRDRALRGTTSAAPASERDWQASFYPIRRAGGGVDGVAVVVSEITERRQAEQTIRERDEQLRLAHAIAELGTWRHDLATNLVHLDARARAHSGLDAEAVPLDTLLALIHPDDRQILSQTTAPSDELTREDRFAGEMRVVAPDQAVRWIAIQAQLYFDVGADGSRRLVQTIGVTRDITARKQAEGARERLNRELATIVETFHEGVVACHPDGAIAVINAAARHIYGLAPEAQPRTADELLAATPLVLRDPDGQELPREQWPLRRVLRGERFSNCELCLDDAGQGAERWIAFSGALIHDEDGAVALRLLTALDITQQRHDEAALRLHATALSRTNAELATALRLKDQFLAMMSHELRTPLNAVLGSSEALAEGLYGPLAERQLRALAMIERSGRHLLAILSDILDLSRIEAGAEQLDVGPIVVDELCQSALRMVQPAADQKVILLRQSNASGAKRLRADERRLTQILVNLLDNAVKFTPNGGTVGLEVTVDAAHEQIQFSVWDTGIGIARDDLGRLFKPFTQLDGRLARTYGGIGLGLTLVRRLVDLHGGSISLTSELSRGSRFTVQLPWSLAEHTAPLPAAPLWSSPPHILIADHDERVLTSYGDLLARYGWQVTSARTGAEAVIRVAERRPDLVVLDVQLPELDGLTIVRRIRALSGRSPVSIVALTNLVVPGEREQYLAAGVTHYLARPVGPRQLSTLLTALLSPDLPGSGAMWQ
ncbi:MAG: PAS domain-containing protein [Chloroflexales bacterium]|nr:PAS domain-containing protein [Chloroflexales bacterium]